MIFSFPAPYVADVATLTDRGSQSVAQWLSGSRYTAGANLNPDSLIGAKAFANVDVEYLYARHRQRVRKQTPRKTSPPLAS